MQLRSLALATTALVAIAAVACPAQAGQYMGKVNLGLGYAWENWDGGEGSSDLDLNYSTLHGSASVNVPYNERVDFQFDIFGNESLDESNDDGGQNDGSFYGGFGAGVHLAYNDPKVGAIGVFGALGRAAIASTSSESLYVYAAGLEGQYYCNNWTLTAQAGYLDSDNSGYGLVKEAGFVHVGGIFYPSSKFKIAGGVGYVDGVTTGTSFGSDVTEWNWAFSIEYLFGKSVPVSTYIEYKGQHSEAYSPNQFEGDRNEVRAGVRFLFGGGDDLQKADREGARWESPDIITWPRFDTD